jgi:hypothetical protein
MAGCVEKPQESQEDVGIRLLVTSCLGLFAMSARASVLEGPGPLLITVAMAVHLLSTVIGLIDFTSASSDVSDLCNGNDDYEEVETHVILLWISTVLSGVAWGCPYAKNSDSSKVRKRLVLRCHFMLKER